MLIAISGSQGSGKTTVLNEITRLGFNVIQRKTSRSVLAELNLTLNQVYSNHEVCKRFHTELLNRKIADEADAVASDKIWFTERTYADLFTYASVTLGWNNDNSEWLNDYYDKCKKQCENYIQAFYLGRLRAGIFGDELVNIVDGVRGHNKHYGTIIDATMYEFTCQMLGGAEPHGRAQVLTHSNLDGRVQTILKSSVALAVSADYYRRQNARWEQEQEEIAKKKLDEASH